MPQRIQRKRTRGWKTPANTLNVTRPGRHGNPYKLGGEFAREDNILRFRIYLDVMEREEPQRYKALVDEVRNADCIMCWCALDKSCHGDVWISRASEPAGSEETMTAIETIIERMQEIGEYVLADEARAELESLIDRSVQLTHYELADDPEFQKQINEIIGDPPADHPAPSGGQG